jgi:hypothetical protein
MAPPDHDRQAIGGTCRIHILPCPDQRQLDPVALRNLERTTDRVIGWFGSPPQPGNLSNHVLHKAEVVRLYKSPVRLVSRRAAGALEKR